MTSRIDRLLTLEEAAEVLGTKPRFTRRLVAERRIRFTRVGRHIRIPESALREFINAGMVEPATPWAHRRNGRAA
jgi:excisionase family DNA binding protein